ncbi:alpha-hydroxy acid oxidase [Caldovatus aquaticus]|uniref:Alpha-hydroxy-acid oxidizing protein n=1 Tax=Caldovatus aquaticus TaxID=2865671 RepID=A0ABS7F2A1_9PROT|nr:alpha-hydroxy acid oxidase [Caldovatus aquaticus]MBW8269731.1 alpha-hydroxy-acid oxidizing protein [Caldovatus aquaticus]
MSASSGTIPARSGEAGAATPPRPALAAARPKPAVPRPLRRYLALQDFEAAARRHLPRMLHGFVAGGVETDWSLRDNRAVFGEWAFLPRVLVDTSGRTTAATLFGRDYAAPFGIAPMGASALIAYRGDLVLARAATAANIPMIMSASSLIPLEEVRRAAANAWYQAYLPGENARIEPLVDRVAAAGFDTFVLTADVPVSANRENNIRNGYSIPLQPSLRLAWEGITHPRWLLGTLLRTIVRHGMPHFENMDAGRGPPIVSRTLMRAFGERDRLSWKHLELIRRRWPGRLVVKGVLAAEDAKIARESGCDGVIVSNHGGRQLDGAIAPLRVLPEVAAAAGGMTVMLDSGVRRGTDVLKALALGARFVFVGRPFLCAAALAGEAGVAHAIRLLAEEVNRDMALLGITRLDQLGPGLLRRVRGAGGG